jgi:hypothetical protein
LSIPDPANRQGDAPEGLPPPAKEDSGADSLQRFAYQEMYTAILAIELFRGEDADYTEIFCEHIEDILLKRNDGLMVGIQIKTRDSGPFKLCDEAIEKAIARFAGHMKDFPSLFAGFVIVSDAGFHESTIGNNLQALLDAVKNGTWESQNEPKWKKFFSDLNNEYGINNSDVTEVLKITRILKGPPRLQIYKVILDDHLGRVGLCSGLKFEQVRVLRYQIVYHIMQASAKLLPTPVLDYIAFSTKKDIKKEYFEINNKRITRDTIQSIFDKVGSNKVLLQSNILPKKLEDTTMPKMTLKMSLGGVDALHIDAMKELAIGTDAYFAERYHLKEAGASNAAAAVQSIRAIVRNQAVEARSSVLTSENRFGPQMLHELEVRLQRMVLEQPERIDDVPYEALKGLIGILTDECLIYFTENPPEGLI